MKILVVGGFGALGKSISQRLREDNHQVFVIDQLGVLPGEDSENYKGATVSDAKSLIMLDHIDVMIHTAEESSIAHCMTSQPFENLAQTADLLNFCATYRMNRVVSLLVTWAEPPDKHESPFGQCAEARKQLPLHFNKGNAVITELALPRIIDPYQSESIFSAVLNRVMYGLVGGHIIGFNEIENPNALYEWCDNKQAVDFVTSFIYRTTRFSQNCYGQIATIPEIVGYILDEVELEKTHIHFGKLGAIEFCRIPREQVNDRKRSLRDIVGRAVQLYIDDYRTNAESDNDTEECVS